MQQGFSLTYLLITEKLMRIMLGNGNIINIVFLNFEKTFFCLNRTIQYENMHTFGKGNATIE